MKKLILITILYLLSISVSKSQSCIDSAISDSIVFSNIDTLSVDTSLEKKLCFNSCYYVCNHIDSIKIINNMENKKEKFFTKKRVVIVSALIGLQIAFGFDPKFTIINLVWLAF